MFALPALHPSKMGNNLSVDKRDAETDLQGLRDEVQEIALQTMQASLSVPDRSSYVPVPGSFPLQTIPILPPVPATSALSHRTYCSPQNSFTTWGMPVGPSHSRRSTHWPRSQSVPSWNSDSSRHPDAPSIHPVTFPSEVTPPPPILMHRIPSTSVPASEDISPVRDNARPHQQSPPRGSEAQYSPSIQSSSSTPGERLVCFLQPATVITESPKSITPSQSPVSPPSTPEAMIHDARSPKLTGSVSDDSPDVQYVADEESPVPPPAGRLPAISEDEEPSQNDLRSSVESSSSDERSIWPAPSPFESPWSDSSSSDRLHGTSSSPASPGNSLKYSHGDKENVPLPPFSSPVAVENDVDLPPVPMTAAESSQSSFFIPPRFSPMVNYDALRTDPSASPFLLPSATPLTVWPARQQARPLSPYYHRLDRMHRVRSDMGLTRARPARCLQRVPT